MSPSKGDFDDQESLVEIIKKILFSAEVIKSALYIPFDSKEDKITGDGIKEILQTKQTEQEKRWEEFKNRVNNPTGKYKTNRPSVKLSIMDAASAKNYRVSSPDYDLLPA